MSRVKRFINLVGQYESKVLGIFSIIRGFANLKELAEISTSFEMKDTNTLSVTGHQREVDPQHAIRIKEYLEKGDNRFLPEIILSIRTEYKYEYNPSGEIIGIVTDGSNGIRIKRKYISKSVRIHNVAIDSKLIDSIKEHKLIRRVDGNHRLALAKELKDDQLVPNKYLTSFCLIIMNKPDNDSDNYSESLIFHTINSTALHLDSEHALRLILGQHPDFTMKPETELAYNPSLYLTRLLEKGTEGLPFPARDRLGNKPLTCLESAAKGMIQLDSNLASNISVMDSFASDLFGALNDIVTRLWTEHEDLCKADYFLELASRVWKFAIGETHDEKVNYTVRYLENLDAWLGRDGLVKLKQNISLSQQLVDIYETVRKKIPKKVFLARWYPDANHGEDLKLANNRLDQVKRTLEDIKIEMGIYIELKDMGTQTGGTIMIHPEMYNAISSSDIILIDLTGLRPNVCIEAGYALKHQEKGRLIFMHHKINSSENVPFDLSTYRYEQYEDCGSIIGLLKPHIKKIIESAIN